MECVELAPAFEPRHTSDSGSKLHALHTLRETRPPPLLRPCNLSRVPREICGFGETLGIFRRFCSLKAALLSFRLRRPGDRRVLASIIVDLNILLTGSTGFLGSVL